MIMCMTEVHAAESVPMTRMKALRITLSDK